MHWPSDLLDELRNWFPRKETIPIVHHTIIALAALASLSLVALTIDTIVTAEWVRARVHFCENILAVFIVSLLAIHTAGTVFLILLRSFLKLWRSGDSLDLVLA